MKNPIGPSALTFLAIGFFLSVPGTEAARKPKVPPPPEPTPEEAFSAFNTQWQAAALAYHIQLVRVTCPGGREEEKACENHVGEVLLLPSRESLDSPAALESIAKKLGAKKGEPYSSFIVPAEKEETHFEAGFWLEKKPAKIRMSAATPRPGDKNHPLSLEVLPFKPGAPFGQAMMFPSRDQTTALVASTSKSGHLILAAVTPLDPWDEEVRLRQAGPVEWVKPPIVPPKLINKVDAEAPERGIDRPSGCTVILGAIIDTAGQPAVIRFLSVPPGCEDTAASVFHAFQKWRFEPARRDNQPIATFCAATIQPQSWRIDLVERPMGD